MEKVNYFPFIHLKVESCVEALEVITGGGPTGGSHPHHAKWTGQAHFAGGRGDLLVLVGQLLLDQRHGVVWLSKALGSQSLQEVLESETLHQIDTDSMPWPRLNRPGHVDRVGRRGAQLGEGRDVDGAGRTTGVDTGFVAWKRIGQRTQLVVDLH